MTTPQRRLAAAPETIDDPAVASIMAHPVGIPPDTDLTAALRRMTSMGIRHLPVIEAGGRCLGVVAEAELVRCLAQGLGLPYSGWLRVGQLVRRVEPIPPDRPAVRRGPADVRRRLGHRSRHGRQRLARNRHRDRRPPVARRARRPPSRAVNCGAVPVWAGGTTGRPALAGPWPRPGAAAAACRLGRPTPIRAPSCRRPPSVPRCSSCPTCPSSPWSRDQLPIVEVPAPGRTRETTAPAATGRSWSPHRRPGRRSSTRSPGRRPERRVPLPVLRGWDAWRLAAGAPGRWARPDCSMSLNRCIDLCREAAS